MCESIGKKIRLALLIALDPAQSEHERIAALNAVDRLLKSDKLDKFAFVDTIGKISTADFKYALDQRTEQIRAEEQARARRQVQTQIQAHQANNPDWLKIANDCLHRREHTTWVNRDGEVQDTREFAQKMVYRLECGQRPNGPSEGEQRYLRRIYTTHRVI
jgi:hypothetical protein